MAVLDAYKEDIERLCKRHHVETLYAFGSVLRPDFSANSDVDLLVKFNKANISKYFENFMRFRSDLSDLFKRPVDLVEEQTVSNPIMKYEIDRSRKLVYGV